MARTLRQTEREEVLADVRQLTRHFTYLTRQRIAAERAGRTWALPLLDAARDAVRSALSAAGATVARLAREGR